MTNVQLQNLKIDVLEELENKWKGLNEHSIIQNIWTAINERMLKKSDSGLNRDRDMLDDHLNSNLSEDDFDGDFDSLKMEVRKNTYTIIFDSKNSLQPFR